MLDNQDLVSVIIRTKNRPNLLERAIKSVCDQDYKNIEIIVVNDGGQDVLELVDKYKSLYEGSDRTFVYVFNKVSVMRSAAANLGLNKAQGKYICLLDDDDYFLKNNLSEHVSVQKKNGNLWSVSKTMESVQDNDGLELEKRPGRLYPFNELKFLFFENYFPSNSVVFQKNLIKKISGFDKSLQVFEDWDMWIRMYLETKPVFIDKVTSVYTTRNGENNVRTSVKSRGIWSDCFMKIMEKYKKGNYKLSGNISMTEISNFLPDHSERWYKMKEENQDLKDSLAFKIYQSGFYKLLKYVKSS